jgi:TatA/E family protein of Tat protein translocase
MPLGVGPLELLVVLVVAALVLGPRRLPGFARSLGRAGRAVCEAKEEIAAPVAELRESVSLDSEGQGRPS